MRMKSSLAACFCGIVSCFAPFNCPADELLGTFLGASAGTTTYTVHGSNFKEAKSLTFGFGFDSAPVFDSSDPLGTFVRDDRIGMDFLMPMAFVTTTGARTFTSADDGFAQVAGRLTNGLDETIALTRVFIDANGEEATPSPTGTRFLQESQQLLHSPDLQGYEVTAIQLNVNSVRYSHSTPGTAKTVRISYDVDWEIYGVSNVPEPGSACCLGLALMGVVVRRRRK